MLQSAIGPDGSVYCLSQTITAIAGGSSATVNLTELTQDGQFVATVNVTANTQALAVGRGWIGIYRRKRRRRENGPESLGFAWQTSLGATTILNLMQSAPDGSLWIAGTTSGLAFAVSPNALQPQPSPGTNPETNPAGFLLHLSADGSKALAATYLPAPLTALALDASDNVVAAVSSEFQATLRAHSGRTLAVPSTPWLRGRGPRLHRENRLGRPASALGDVERSPGSRSAPWRQAQTATWLLRTPDSQGDVILSAMTTVPGPPRLVETCIGQAASPYLSGRSLRVKSFRFTAPDSGRSKA